MPALKILAAASLAAILLSGCATPAVPYATPIAPPTGSAAGTPAGQQLAQPTPVATPEPEPIDMGPAGSKPLSFQRVILTMEPGAKIGQVTGGWLNVVASTLHASPGEISRQVGVIGQKELRDARYTIPGDENSLFERDESAKARYQLGAKITWIQLNVHFQVGWSVPTIRTTGAMTVDWELFDTLAQKVVFTRTTDVGIEEETKGDSGIPGDMMLFRKSIRQLLAQPEFASFMRPDSAESGMEPPPPPSAPLAISGAPSATHLQLPADFPAAVESLLALEPGSGLGSAFLISGDGYALTAAHVVSGLKTVPARLQGGVVLQADVVRVDEASDVALIKLPGTSYSPLGLEPGSQASVGTDVYAMGNPAAKELIGSVTKGVVRGNREFAGRKFIQTDAAANPGSSGGPLLDKSGHVIGLISWKFAGPEYQGLAFAVPIREALARLNITMSPSP